jgi:hypothetical protein
MEVSFDSRFFLLVLCLITRRDVLTFNCLFCKFVTFKFILNITLKNCLLLCDAVYSGECYVLVNPSISDSMHVIYSLKIEVTLLVFLSTTSGNSKTEWRLAPCVLNIEATWW